MRILGIESSCDETAAAVVNAGRTIESNLVASQHDLHRPFGGVVPEVAARAHAERITALLDEALRSAGATPDSIDAISVVNRPGLVGALLVGIAAAKALALAWRKPLVAVDHIHGHVYAAPLAGFDVFPHLSLIVSGGHTSLYRVDSPLQLRTLGQTADDAAGEAFDKVAKLLNLGFPGGPALAKLAAQATTPGERALFLGVSKATGSQTPQERASLDFSFSGLKTAVYYRLRGTTAGRGALRTLDEAERIAVAASFEAAACEQLIRKTLLACTQQGLYAVAVGGGVACNRYLRERFQQAAEAHSPKVRIFFPPPDLCTDNAAMSAGLAYHLAQAGQWADSALDADPTPRRA
jgi:N6-L-threonylcarbamoyladenine synthase